jgi:Calcineurin-like phosphoesterase
MRRCMLIPLTVLAAAGAGPSVAHAADPVIAAAGDIACGPDDFLMFPCEHVATSDALLALDPDAVLVLGDTQYNSGRLADFQQFYDPSWGRVKAISWPVIGNHEYSTPGGAGYFDYFNGAGARTGRAGDRAIGGYYSFDLGAWHIVALNSNCAQVPGGCGPGSPQERWLRADLAARRTSCTLAFAHHPLWASDNGAFRTPAIRPLVEALYEADTELLLVGHDHDYERFAPSAPDQSVDPARGLRQIIVGTGGRDLSGFGPVQPNSEVRNSTAFGVLKVTLGSGSYAWEFVRAAGGQNSDSGSQACHGSPPPPPPPAAGTTTPRAPLRPATTPDRPGGTAGAPRSAGLKVTSVRVGRRRILVRGTLAPGASADRMRVTVVRTTRRLRLRKTVRASGARSGRFRAAIALPRFARGVRKFRLVVHHLGDQDYAPQVLRLSARRR